MGILAVCNTYLVDVMEARSAEVIATNKYAHLIACNFILMDFGIPSCLRYVAAAGASAVVLPIIQAIGVAPTNAIAAAIAWIGFALICATIKYGQGWREAWCELEE